MNITSPNHIGIEIGKVIDVNASRIKIRLDKPLAQGDGIRFLEEQEGMMVNFIYDKKDNLISHANRGDIIELDNKVGITKCNSVLKTVDSKLLEELEHYSEKKIPISMKVIAHLGNSFQLEVTDFLHTVRLENNIIEEATGNGTSSNRILEQLSKLGDTPFTLNSSNLDIEDGIFIPISKINELRRKAILELIAIRENEIKEVIICDRNHLEKINLDSRPVITALVRKEEQLLACLEEKVDSIYVTDFSLYQKYKEKGNIYLRIDRVMNHYLDFKQEKLLIGEMGSVNSYKEHNQFVSDYYLNVTNSYHIAYLRKLGISNITLSIENSIDEIENIVHQIGNSGLEVLVYGKVEAMIMKYCPLKMLVNQDKTPCNICRNGKVYELKDRNGARYPLIQDKELTHIFYYQNLNLENDIRKLKQVPILRYRFEFFDENCQEIHSLLKKYKTILS